MKVAYFFSIRKSLYAIAYLRAVLAALDLDFNPITEGKVVYKQQSIISEIYFRGIAVLAVL